MGRDGWRMASREANGARVIGVPVPDASFFKRVRAAGRLQPGDVPKQGLTLKAAEATRLLRGIIRFVADIPADTSPVVVWQADGSELWVDISTVSMACAPSLVRVSVKVGCDQLPDAAVVTVPFGVGSAAAPTGLVMSTLTRLDGPPVVVDRWTAGPDGLRLGGRPGAGPAAVRRMGTDKAGLALIPGSIAAGASTLLIQPMSRNDLSALGR